MRLNKKSLYVVSIFTLRFNPEFVYALHRASLSAQQDQHCPYQP